MPRTVEIGQQKDPKPSLHTPVNRSVLVHGTVLPELPELTQH